MPEEDLSPNAEFVEIAEPGDPAPVRQVGPALSEAQRRIKLARYYEAFLEGTVFNNPTPESEQVEQELRDYAIQRMEILLGIRQETPAYTAQFSDLEVQALKVLAQRVISGPSTRAITVSDAPAINRRDVSTTQVNAAPTPAPVPSRRPVKQEDNKPLPPPAIAQKQGMVLKTAANADLGERFAENGQWYMWTLNEAGERYKKSVGGLSHNPAAVQMPTGPAMAYATADSAARTIATSLNAMESEMTHPKTDDQTRQMIR